MKFVNLKKKIISFIHPFSVNKASTYKLSACKKSNTFPRVENVKMRKYFLENITGMRGEFLNNVKWTDSDIYTLYFPWNSPGIYIPVNISSLEDLRYILDINSIVLIISFVNWKMLVYLSAFWKFSTRLLYIIFTECDIFFCSSSTEPEWKWSNFS